MGVKALSMAAPAALAALFALGAAEARPSRVVSIHLCADQLLLRLADAGQIAAVTHLAADPARSYMAVRARGVPITNGLAEQVIALGPDLVLAGVYSARETVRILDRLGVRVLDLDLPQDFRAIRKQIGRVARALEQGPRGERLIAEMDGRLARIRVRRAARRPLAANYQPNGYSMGPGTLEHVILAAAGLENLTARLGLGRVGQIPLERMIAARPDVVVFTAAAGREPSLGRQLLAHPAFRHATQGARILTLPRRLGACGSWYTAEAVEWLLRRTRNLAKGKLGS